MDAGELMRLVGGEIRGENAVLSTSPTKKLTGGAWCNSALFPSTLLHFSGGYVTNSGSFRTKFRSKSSFENAETKRGGEEEGNGGCYIEKSRQIFKTDPPKNNPLDFASKENKLFFFYIFFFGENIFLLPPHIILSYFVSLSNLFSTSFSCSLFLFYFIKIIFLKVIQQFPLNIILFI